MPPLTINTQLRILLVDSHPARHRDIERALNAHGYYRVAPLRQFNELLAVLHNAVMVFDLVMISERLSRDPLVELRELCSTSPWVRNFLIYDDPLAPAWQSQSLRARPRVQLNITGLPTVGLLGQVLEWIEQH